MEGSQQAKKVAPKRTSALRGAGSHAKPGGKLLQSDGCKPQPPTCAWQSSLRGAGAYSKPSAKLKSQAAASIKPGANERAELAPVAGGAPAPIAPMAPSLARPKGAHSAASAARPHPPSQAIKGKGWSAEPPVAHPLSIENNLTPNSHFSPTTSDLASDNSYLKLSQSSFPSIPSITSTQLSSEDSPIRPILSSESSILQGASFVTAGAGTHCPPPNPKTKMASESSIVKRGSRARASVSRVTNLEVLGVNYGPEAMRALRLCFKVYFFSFLFIFSFICPTCSRYKQKKVT